MKENLKFWLKCIFFYYRVEVTQYYLTRALEYKITYKPRLITYPLLFVFTVIGFFIREIAEIASGSSVFVNIERFSSFTKPSKKEIYKRLTL